MSTSQTRRAIDSPEAGMPVAIDDENARLTAMLACGRPVPIPVPYDRIVRERPDLLH